MTNSNMVSTPLGEEGTLLEEPLEEGLLPMRMRMRRVLKRISKALLLDPLVSSEILKLTTLESDPTPLFLLALSQENSLGQHSIPEWG